MTKTQAKSKLRKLKEMLENITCEIEDLKQDIDDTAESIEPYEGCNDLTQEQYDRQEWFEEVGSNLEDLIDSINQFTDYVEEQ